MTAHTEPKMRLDTILKRCQWVAQMGGLSPAYQRCAAGAMCCGCIFDYQMACVEPHELSDEWIEAYERLVRARSKAMGGVPTNPTEEEAIEYFEGLKLCQN